MVTADEQHALQLVNAGADAQFWNSLAHMHGAAIQDHKGLIASAEQKVARNEAQRANAAERAAQAMDRVARIERGEDVPGRFGKPYARRSHRYSCGRRLEQIRHAPCRSSRQA